MEKDDQATSPLTPQTDRPLDGSNRDEDEFGFSEIAKKLSPSLLAATETDGLVIGIEGAWGTGKTTLLNFVVAELEASSDEHTHVIKLPPWLYGSADDLVTGLFSQLIPALEQQEEKPKGWFGWSKKDSDIVQTLKSYGAKAGRGISPFLKLAGIFHSAFDKVGQAVDIGSAYLEKGEQPRSISEQKDVIASYLRKSKLKFVVLLDDLDRLEPNQTTEVVRLVRSVADFPKVVYCLCYDRSVLKHALEHGLNVEDGNAYLHKIVQQTFSMPKPEPFDLRYSLKRKLIALYEDVNGVPISEEELSDLEGVVDQEGNRLSVPRDINLVINAVKFCYPQIKGDVYFPDMCWIQIIRATNIDLYDWIEDYLGTRSVITMGRATLGKSGQKKFGKKLKKLLPDDDNGSVDSIWNLGSRIPGLSRFDDPKDCVFQETSRVDISSCVLRKGIGSPVHSRVYFAFSIPKALMSDEKFEELNTLARADTAELSKRLAQYAAEQRPVGGSWFNHIMDRLEQIGSNSIDEETLSGWVIAICDCMDVVLKEDNEIRAFALSTADRTKFVIQRHIRSLREKNANIAEKTVRYIFTNSPSICWLIGDLFRQELFDHGIVGTDRARPHEVALSRDEVDEYRDVLKSRLKKKDVRVQIETLPELPGFLYGWRDLAGIRSPKAWVRKYIENDLTFLEFLIAMRGWMASDKVYYPLRKSDVELFVNWSDVLSRLDRLEASDDPQKVALVAQIREAIEIGRDE